MSPGAELAKIAVHGVPRSGTTWLGEIFNSSPRVIFKFQPLFSYALKDFLTPDASRQEIDAFFEALRVTEDAFLDRSDERERGLLPSFTKEEATHVVYKEVRYHHILRNLLRKSPDVRLVAFVRNPLSVINSWLRAPREFRADLGWEEREEWRYAPKKNLKRPEEFFGYERWKEATRIFQALKDQHPERVHVLEYRKLLADPEAEVAGLFAFCSLEVGEQTREFLVRSTSESHPDTYSVFRAGQSDDKWRTELDPAIADEILTDLAGTALAQFAER